MSSPIAKFKAGGVTAAVFQNTSQRGTSYSVNLQRAYFDKKTQKVGYTTGLNINDIPKALVVLQEAYRWLVTGGPEGQAGEEKTSQASSTPSPEASVEEDTPF